MIKLDRDLILRLYCCFCQAMRSVHRGHAGSWWQLREYYQGERTEAILALVRRLQAALADVKGDCQPQNREEAMRRVPKPGPFRILFGPLINRWRTSWRFAVPEVGFMVSTLKRLQSVLDCPTKPDEESLIALRRDLTACTWPLDCRCYGLSQLKQARRIEHFDRTEWYPHLQLAEILTDAGVPLMARQRQSTSAGP